MPHYMDTSGEVLPRMYGTEHEFLIFPRFPAQPVELVGGILTRHLPGYISTAGHMGFATNGARIYQDVYGAFEYATAEAMDIRSAIAAEIAGERITLEALASVNGELRMKKEYVDTRNPQRKFDAVVDYGVITPLGQTVGHHENYLTARSVPMETILPLFMGFLASRVLFNGAGYASRSSGGGYKYMLGQKASTIHKGADLGTTSNNKPLFNTRDEAHADKNYWRRLHVVSGDAHLSPYARFLTLGTTSLVLRIAEWADTIPHLLPDIEPLNPVAAIHKFSGDMWGNVKVEMGSQKDMSALDIQARLIEAARKVADKTTLPDDEQVALKEWETWESDMRIQSDSLKERIPSHTKEYLIRTHLDRKGHAPDSEQALISARDINYWYSELSPKGLGLRRRSVGVDKAYMPPEDLIDRIKRGATEGRARYRGKLIRSHIQSGRAVIVNWDEIVEENTKAQINDLSNPFIGTKIEPELIGA